MRKHDASRTSGSSARMVEVRVRGRNFASARLAVRRSFLALRFHEDPTRVADELTLGLGQSEIFGCTPIKQSERVAGIEPAPQPWRGRTLPLRHTRMLEIERQTASAMRFYSARGADR